MIKPLALTLAVLSASCATRDAVFSDYYSQLRETPQGGPGKRTVVLFLVDGLSERAVSQGVSRGELDELKGFFGPIYRGQAQFPTLTYPNISSILTGESIEHQPINGNKMWLDGKAYNFEGPSDSSTLNRLLAPSSVFTALEKSGSKSVSLSFFFNGGATVSIAQDIKSGIAYAAHDYSYVDDKVLGAMDRLLRDTPTERWPEFVFVHLIGVDSMAHRFGPRSHQARDYLASLSKRLQPSFEALKRGEQAGREVVTILTADHGFMEVERTLHFEAALRLADPSGEVRALNMGRIAALEFPDSWRLSQRLSVVNELAAAPGMGMVAVRVPSGVIINQRGASIAIRARAAACRGSAYEIAVVPLSQGASGNPVAPAAGRYSCLDEFDREQGKLFYPEFAANIVRYFQTPHRPAALALADDGTSLSEGLLGQHGGPTEEELYVPLLMRGARLKSNRVPIPTYKLLAFLKAKSVAAPGESFSAIEGQSAKAEAKPGVPVQHSLQLSAPVSFVTLHSKPKGGSEQTFVSRFSPALDVLWEQHWSEKMAILLGYQVGFQDFTTDPGIELGTDSSAVHQLRAGAGYRFGDRSILFGSLSLGQYYFRSEDPPAPASASSPAASIRLERLWIPEFTFGNRSRIFSIGIGDLVALGGISVLLPKTDGSIHAATGFKQSMGFAFEQPVKNTDLMGVSVQVDHLNQSTNLEYRSMWLLRFGFYYGIAFI